MDGSHVVNQDLTITLMSCSRSCHEFTRFFIARLRAFSSSSSCSFCEPAWRVRSIFYSKAPGHTFPAWRGKDICKDIVVMLMLRLFLYVSESHSPECTGRHRV